MVSGMKELHRLMRKISKVTDKQASIQNTNWDAEMGSFEVSIRPNGGLYKNGKFDFRITLHDNYPEKPPLVWCLTDIYHPNIDTTEDCDDSCNVCLNLLDNGTWAPSFGLEGVVLGLLFLFYHPNLESTLSPYFDSCSGDLDIFEENVKHYMAGEAIDDGTTFNTPPDFNVTGEQKTDTDSTHVDDKTVDCTDIVVQAKIECVNPDSKWEKSIEGSDKDCETEQTCTDESTDNTESVALSLISVDGECVLLFTESNENAENEITCVLKEVEAENLDTISGVVKTYHGQTNPSTPTITPAITCSDSTTTWLSGEETKPLDLLAGTGNIDCNTNRKTRYTCGLWSSFRTICVKLVHEIVRREINNDVIL